MKQSARAKKVQRKLTSTDPAESSGVTDQGSRHYIEDTLLLKFLIARYSEMLGTDEQRLDPVWAGLGMVALHQNVEMESAFNILISTDSFTVEEVLRSSIDLFLAELDRLEKVDTTDWLERRVERRSLTPRTARKFLFWSWREGRKMSLTTDRDFRFYSIWELVSWLGLTSDEYIKEFEEKCRSSKLPKEKRLEEGLEVIKAAIFPRRIDNTSFQPLKTSTTQIDMETNK